MVNVVTVPMFCEDAVDALYTSIGARDPKFPAISVEY